MGRGSSKIGGSGGGALFQNSAFITSESVKEDFEKWNSFRESFGSTINAEISIVETNYVGTGASFDLNFKLYNPNASELTSKQKDTVKALDKMISEHRTPSDAIYTRYSDADAIKGILGLTDGQINQLINVPSFSDSDMALLNKAVGGAETLSKGFNSTSAIKKHIFSGERFRREISVPKGTNAYCTENRHEHEVIFGRNMRTTLDHISWDGKNIVLHERFLRYD